jgi:hypothetical protein
VALNVWAFAAVTVPLVATPGVSTAVVLRNSLAGGTRSGIATAIGANLGSVCYGMLTRSACRRRCSAGRCVDRAAHRRHRVSRVAGIAIAAPRAHVSADRSVGQRPRAASPLARSLREGFVTNVLNPSLATFYLLIIPEFIPRGAPFARSALDADGDPRRARRHVAPHLGGRRRGAVGHARAHAPARVLEAISGLALLALA